MKPLRSFEIPPNQKGEIVLASGGVNLGLGQSIAVSLGVELADVELKRHPNDERYVRYNESVRGKDVVIVQSHASNSGYLLDEAINEQKLLARTAKGSSARSVTVIAPYLGYSRSDRKARGREVAASSQVIEEFEIAGVSKMMSVDLHSQQTAEHFRAGSYEHLTAQPLLRQAIEVHIGEKVLNSIVVAPDAGSVKNNNRHAEELSKTSTKDIEVAFMGKERPKGDSSNIIRANREVAGVDGKTCLIFDDMIDGGSTMVSAAENLKNSGAKEIYIAATHPIFSGSAPFKLANSVIDRVFVTDSLPTKKAKKEMGDKLEVVQIGPLVGRAIYEIMTGGSISKLFDDQNHH